VTAGVLVRRSSEPRPGRPKPIYATASAIEAAERAGVAGCVEERVREGILGGRKRRSLPGLPPREGGSYVVLDDRAALVAVLARIPARLQPGRGAWLVVDVIRPPRPFALRAAGDGDRTAAVQTGTRRRPQERTAASQKRTYVRSRVLGASRATEPEIRGEIACRREADEPRVRPREVERPPATARTRSSSG